MNKLLLIGGLAVLTAGATVAALATTGHTPGGGSVSTSQRFSCLDISGTLTTEGVTPDVSCLTGDGGGQLKITTRATPAATPAPASPSATVRSSSGTTRVNITGSSDTQSSSSGTTVIEHSSQSSSSQGNASNTSHSTTNITVTNR